MTSRTFVSCTIHVCIHYVTTAPNEINTLSPDSKMRRFNPDDVERISREEAYSLLAKGTTS